MVLQVLLEITIMGMCLTIGYLHGKGSIVINKTVKLTKEQEKEIADNLEKDKVAREKQEQLIEQYNLACQQLEQFMGGK